MVVQVTVTEFCLTQKTLPNNRIFQGSWWFPGSPAKPHITPTISIFSVYKKALYFKCFVMVGATGGTQFKKISF